MREFWVPCSREREHGTRTRSITVWSLLLRRQRRLEMDGIYLLGGGVALLLFVYLMIALLKPEWFV
jgi:K+-transporting ATPase KdpF subunit